MKRPSLRRLLPQLAALLLSLTPLVANGIGQVCYVGNDRSTPNEDLIDHGDQTVSHSKTGLMWKQCEEGLSGAGCTGSFLFLDWGQALGAATSANINKFAGYDDWRLPNWKELQSIIETGCHFWTVNLTRFPRTDLTDYWTSTTAADRTRAWQVSFGSGLSSAESKSVLNPVRLVRGGPGFAAHDRLIVSCTLDIDGNNTVNALTDGLLLLRAMFGLTGAAVTAGAIAGDDGSGAPTRTDWVKIRTYLNGSCGTSFGP